MDTNEAIRVIRTLAAGNSPETGEPLQIDALRRPLIVRALNRALGALVRQDEWERSRPRNAFRSWTRPEIAKVCEEVQQGMDFHEIAKLHNRSVSSIVARLIKLGKIKPPATKAA